MTPADLLSFPNAGEDVEIPLEEPTIEIEPEPEPEIEPEPSSRPAPASSPDAPSSVALMEVLPADFKLPALIKFIPNPELRRNADKSATYALSLTVDGAEGLQRADLALAAVRTTVKAIEEHLEEPITVANALHKRLTSVRGEWCERGKQAIATVGQRIYAEQRRLDALADAERRKAQEEADAAARETARREAEAAAKAQAPAPVVEELKRQAETATAPPVSTPASAAPALRSSTTVTTWKARLKDTSGAAEPNPAIDQLTGVQRLQVFELLKAILDGKAPLAAIDINWPYLNKRAKADKSTLAIAGVEAFEEGGVRAKGSRSK